MSGSVVRAMTAGDLPAVWSVTNAAFGALHDAAGGQPPAEPRFPALFFGTRFAADPDGCFIAVSGQDPGRVAGALISLARGTLGWFGPLAVHPDVQQSGVGEQLVAACLAAWRRRGVRLMGLETFADSGFHVPFYQKMGFRPAWTGISFQAQPGESEMPAGVETGGRIPDLGFLYPGLDVSGEAAATTRCGAGQVLTTHDGVAIVHLESTFQPPGTGFVPFLAAATRDSFDKLLGAAEHLSRQQGKTSVLVRTSGSSWATIDALGKRGYRAGRVMVRMKAGDDLDYDRTNAYYLDNWL